MGTFWFGTDRLWTRLPVEGTLRLGSNLTEKLFWWRQGYVARAEPQPKLTVTGRRLDALVPALKASRATNANLSEGDAMLVGVDFPTPGCWEITGRYYGDRVTFVVWIEQ